MRRTASCRLFAAPAVLFLLLGLTLPACSTAAPGPTAAGPTASAEPTAVASAEPTATAEPSAEAPDPVPPPLPNTGERLTQAGIKKIVRASFERMAKCFEKGLERDPSMKGRVDIMLAIADEGEVVSATAQPPAEGNPPGDMPALTDPQVRACIERHFKSLRFPPTNRGIMNLIYPVVFSLE